MRAPCAGLAGLVRRRPGGGRDDSVLLMVMSVVLLVVMFLLLLLVVMVMAKIFHLLAWPWGEGPAHLFKPCCEKKMISVHFHFEVKVS